MGENERSPPRRLSKRGERPRRPSLGGGESGTSGGISFQEDSPDTKKRQSLLVGGLQSMQQKRQSVSALFSTISDVRFPCLFEECKVETPDDREERMKSFANKMWFQGLIYACIIVNALCIGLEVDHAHKGYLGWLDPTETMFTLIYLLEVVAQGRVAGWEYFEDNWHVFDYLIVAIGIMGLINQKLIFPAGLQPETEDTAQQFAVVRMVRLGRLLKAVHLVRAFRDLVILAEGFVRSLVPVLSVSLMLFTWCYVVANYWVVEYHDQPYSVPSYNSIHTYHHPTGQTYYAALATGMFTMFSMSTGEQISASRDAFAYEANEAGDLLPTRRPATWPSLMHGLVFLVGKYAILTVLLAIMIERAALASGDNERLQLDRKDAHEKKVIELISKKFEKMDADGSGELSYDEFEAACSHKSVRQLLEMLEVPLGDMEELFHMLDRENDGCISQEEFLKGLMDVKGTASALKIFQLQCSVEREATRLEHICHRYRVYNQSLDAVLERIEETTNLQETHLNVRTRKEQQSQEHSRRLESRERLLKEIDAHRPRRRSRLLPRGLRAPPVPHPWMGQHLQGSVDGGPSYMGSVDGGPSAYVSTLGGGDSYESVHLAGGDSFQTYGLAGGGSSYLDGGPSYMTDASAASWLAPGAAGSWVEVQTEGGQDSLNAPRSPESRRDRNARFVQ